MASRWSVPRQRCKQGGRVLPASGTLHQQDKAQGCAEAHLSWGGLALAFASTLLEGRARDTADDGMHAMGAGTLAGRWGCHLRGAVGQVGLCSLASHSVDPEAVFLAEGLEAARGEEQGPASAQVSETLPPNTHAGCSPMVPLTVLPRAEPYLELGSFSFMFQSFLGVQRAGRSWKAVLTLQGSGLPPHHPCPPQHPMAEVGATESSQA